MSSARRAVNIDLVKTIAIFCVVFIHAGGVYYAFPVGSFSWNSALFYGSLVRAGVPLFLMCSGALMLDPQKNTDIRRLYTHNIPRLLAAMFFWGLAYKVWHLAFGEGITVSGVFHAVKELLLFKQEFHFYYLHIILLVYAFLPVTRCFVASAPRSLIRYALVLWFAFGILYPTVSCFWPFTLLGGMAPQYLINMTYASVGYGVLGRVLYESPPSGIRSGVCAAAGFAVVFGGTYALSMRDGCLNELFFSGMTVGTFLLAVGIYGLCIRCGQTIGSRAARIVCYVSRASFCVYLTHMFVIYILEGFGFYVAQGVILVTVPLVSLVVIGVCLAVYAVLSRVPVLNKWIV